MGAVYLARQDRLDRRVAIKFLHAASGSTVEAHKRFERRRREPPRSSTERARDARPRRRARRRRRALHGDGVPAGRGPLGCARAPRALPARRGDRRVVVQACNAIGEAHQRGIVHRDLKPANLFVARRSNGTAIVKVLDFGISKAQGSYRRASRSPRRERSSVGSPLYMSPEQIRESRNVDGRADVWALGIILYELLTGQTPFQSEAFGELCALILTSPPPGPWSASSCPDVSPSLEAIILRCLQKDAAQRFANVGELVAALRSGRTASPGRRPRRRPRRRCPWSESLGGARAHGRRGRQDLWRSSRPTRRRAGHGSRRSPRSPWPRIAGALVVGRSRLRGLASVTARVVAAATTAPPSAAASATAAATSAGTAAAQPDPVATGGPSASASAVAEGPSIAQPGARSRASPRESTSRGRSGARSRRSRQGQVRPRRPPSTARCPTSSMPAGTSTSSRNASDGKGDDLTHTATNHRPGGGRGCPLRGWPRLGGAPHQGRVRGGRRPGAVLPPRREVRRVACGTRGVRRRRVPGPSPRRLRAAPRRARSRAAEHRLRGAGRRRERHERRPGDRRREAARREPRRILPQGRPRRAHVRVHRGRPGLPSRR